jgi:sterol 3beta-glucosyltransferase
MRFTLLTIGSRGDVQPLVALGQGLRRAGHEVRIATFETFRPLVEQAGLVLAPLVGNAKTLTESEDADALVESGQNIAQHVRAIRAISRKLTQTEGYWESFSQACRGAEAIIYNYTAPQGYHLAERFKIPGILVAPTPAVAPTGDFPHPFWPGEPKLGAIFNRMTHSVCEQFMWQPFRTMINQWRLEHLGLPPMSMRGPYSLMRRSLVLYSCSPSVIPRASGWGEQVQLTGFWYSDPVRWEPDRRLTDFLKSGSRPVYIGFGSVGVGNEEASIQLAREALRLSGQRGIVGVRQPGSLEAANDFLPVGDVPYEWLFPKMACVVHHGGAGTTAAAFRDGIPNVVFPHFSDQPFWGRRIAELGVGPTPIPGKELTAGRLAVAITETLNNPAILQKAALLGEKIRPEDGVRKAVEVITWYLGRSQSKQSDALNRVKPSWQYGQEQELLIEKRRRN